MDQLHIIQTGEVCFAMDDISACTKLKIDKTDFSIDFDWQKCIFIASWKWTNGQSLDDLKNKNTEVFRS